MGDKDFSLYGLLKTADELISQRGPNKDCIRAYNALEFLPQEYQRSRDLVLCVYRNALETGTSDFEDYRCICEGGQRFWKNQPKIASYGLRGMRQTADRRKQRRLIRRSIRRMKEMGWNTK